MSLLCRVSVPKLCHFHKYSAGISSLWKNRARYSSHSNPSKDEEEDLQPMKYTESKAAQWRASYSLGREPSKKKEPPPPSQITVIMMCIAAFLIYFCVLREENDLDIHLRKDLFEQVPGLKEKHDMHVKSVENIGLEKK
ncbi:hypothetical protein CHUAL_013522 [Chamberlinius hualienensis]